LTFGTVKNPHDTERIPGGSSGGSAVAVTAGIVPVALGSDTGGSVRIPAALCVCVGFRPTLGRYPTDGVVPVSYTHDTVGVFARTVRDIMKVDEVIVSEDKGDSLKRCTSLLGLRIGIPRKYFYENLDPELSKIIETVLQKFKDRGAVLVETNIECQISVNIFNLFNIINYETPRDFSHYLFTNNSDLTLKTILTSCDDLEVRSYFNIPVSNAQYREALKMREKFCDSLRNFFSENRIDVFILPTTPVPACKIGQKMVRLGDVETDIFTAYIRSTHIAALAGVPSVSIPVGKTEGGLPVGIEVVGPEYLDRTLLSITEVLEIEIGYLL